MKLLETDVSAEQASSADSDVSFNISPISLNEIHTSKGLSIGSRVVSTNTRKNKIQSFNPKDSTVPKEKKKKRLEDATANILRNSKLSLNDAIDCLADNEAGWMGAEVYITPDDIYCSDGDSGGEEDFSKGQLLSHCELQVQPVDPDCDILILENCEDVMGNQLWNPSSLDPSLFKKGKCQGPPSKWCEAKEGKSSYLKTLVHNFEVPANDYFSSENMNKMRTPESLFELFFDEEVTKFICEINNNYAIESQACYWAILTPSELRCFIGIIILSGYCKIANLFHVLGGSITCPKSISKECNDKKSLQGNPNIHSFL